MAPPTDDDLIVVCTAAGMVSLHRDGFPLERDPGSARADGCVFCLPLMQGHLSSPTEMAVIQPAETFQQARFHGIAASAPVRPRMDGGAHPQAPPLS